MTAMTSRESGAFLWPLIAALGLFLGSAGAVTLMYLLRTSDPRLIDALLPNYFAYYQDLIVAPVAILFLLVVLLLPPPKLRLPAIGPRAAAICAVAVAVVAVAGTHWLFGGYALSRDEYMADFDARIFGMGALFAHVPAPWRSMVDALQPDFLFRTADGAYWSSSYLPGNAAIRAMFGIVGAQSLASPVLAALAAGLLYAIARKLEPDDPGFAAVALLLLLTSAQFLLTAMTPYAMTAHLALNLAWLWLALHDRPWSRAAAVAVSFVACGLHQMIFHPLFVLPFLPWLWLTGRRRIAILYGLAVMLSGLFWLNYWSIALAVLAPGASVAGLLRVPLSDRIEALVNYSLNLRSLFFGVDNLLRLLTWQNPLIWPLLLACLFSLRRLPRISWCLLGSILVTAAAVLVLMPYQGHGWGYRYLHGLLGSFALLAAYGWKAVGASTKDEAQRPGAWLSASVILSLALLIPLRAYHSWAFVEPYREADSRLSRIDADVVIIDSVGRWYATDLVRNDPRLTNRPLRLLAAKLSRSDAAALCGRHRVRLVSGSSTELASVRALTFRGERAASAQRVRALRALGCG